MFQIAKKKYLDDLIISMSATKVKAATFLPDIEYIKQKRGEDGVNAVLEEMRKRGYNYDFRKMKRVSGEAKWVSGEVRKVFLEVTMGALGWDEKRIFDMALNAPRMSLVIKLLFGLYLTVERVFKAAPDMWAAHYSPTTAFKVAELKIKQGYARVIIENFDISPIFCEYMRGYITGVGKLTEARDVKVEETKCTFRGDEYHEYMVTWK